MGYCRWRAGPRSRNNGYPIAPRHMGPAPRIGPQLHAEFDHGAIQISCETNAALLPFDRPHRKQDQVRHTLCIQDAEQFVVTGS